MSRAREWVSGLINNMNPRRSLWWRESPDYDNKQHHRQNQSVNKLLRT